MRNGIRFLLIVGLVFTIWGCNNQTTTESLTDSTNTTVSEDTTDSETTENLTTVLTPDTPLTPGAEVGFQIDITSAKVLYDLGETFDASALVVNKITDNAVREELDNAAYTVDSSTYNSAAAGKYAISVSYGTYASQTYYVWVVETWTMISTPEELMAMTASGTYKLANDIDCIDTEWITPTLVFSGVLNGNGYMIKNITLEATAPKVGVLFAEVANGMVCNVRFDSCVVTSVVETVGLITGLCNGGLFKSIEITSSSITTTNNYAGLIYGRNYGAVSIITLDSITVKNSTSVTAAKYGGILSGDQLVGTNFICKNVDLNATCNILGGEIGGIIGRDRGAISTIENILVRNVYLQGINKAGVITEGAVDASNMGIKNVIILAAESIVEQTSDIFTGQNKGIFYLENCYYVLDNVSVLVNSLPGKITRGVGINASDIPTDLYTTFLNFDFVNKWEDLGNDLLIIGSSPNKPGVDATIVELKLNTNKVQKKFYTGIAYNADNLAVVAKYSDGVEIPIGSDLYTIDSSTYNSSVTGTYTITVTATGTSITASYDVDVVEVIDLILNTEFMTKTYIVNEATAFSSTNLVVKGNLSNSTIDILDASVYTIDSSTFNGNLAGVYTITITYATTITKTFDVTVIGDALTTIGSVPSIYIDAEYAGVDGAVTEGKNTFKTIKAGLDYLSAAITYGLTTNQVEKRLYLSDGEFYEKLTISIPNITLIGEYDALSIGTQDGNQYYEPISIITYDAAAGTFTPSNSIWGTQGSASVSIKPTAVGFKAANILFENSFDYFGSTIGDKQAVALVNEADEVVFHNCKFTSIQDTLYAKTGRQYYSECFIGGSVDFIFGNNAPVLFEDCIIHTYYRESDTNNGYITAVQGTSNGAGAGTVDYGYVFLNCHLTSDAEVSSGTVSLGRPWRAWATVAYISCDMGAHISTLAYDSSPMSRWEEMSGVAPTTATIKFYEYNSIGAGAITTAVAGGSVLNSTQAANYTITNIFSDFNGSVIFSEAFNGEVALSTLVSLYELD